MEERITHYPIQIPFTEGRYKVPPDELGKNCYDLGFYVRCGNCNYENTINWCGPGLSFKMKSGESYTHITCPKCGYDHKID